jgi:hypothetical protein
LRHGVPGPLEQLEEVVGPVDLVHLAGLRVTDHDPRAEHEQPPCPDLLADDLLRVVLGAVVGVGQFLSLVEHVLLEDALVSARHRDRAGVMEATDLDRVRELDDVPGALDVRLLHRLLVRAHVVDRGEVEEVVDRRREALHAQSRLGEVARDRYDASLGRAQSLHQ